MAWTPRQRVVLIGLGAALLALAGWRSWHRAALVSDPPPEQGLRAGELPGRVDPNAATWQVLATLPNIGPKRAQEIVAYREQFLRDHPERPAFQCAEDLDQVKGIGPATVEQLRPYLDFHASELNP